MHERKGRTVKPPTPEPTHKPSPFVCPDCGETMHRHGSGKFWCEECGSLKERADIWDLNNEDDAKAAKAFRAKKIADQETRAENAARALRTAQRAEAARLAKEAKSDERRKVGEKEGPGKRTEKAPDEE